MHAYNATQIKSSDQHLLYIPKHIFNCGAKLFISNKKIMHTWTSTSCMPTIIFPRQGVIADPTPDPKPNHSQDIIISIPEVLTHT